MTLRTSKRPGGARGFSLVEIMVAMALSLILLAGVLAIFASSRKTFETNDRLSRIQESGRFALDSIVRDIRAAGYIGCSQRAPLINLLNNNAAMLWKFDQPMQGFDWKSSNTWLPALDTTPLTKFVNENDAIVLRIPKHDTTGVQLTADMSGSSGDIEVDATRIATIAVGDTVMINDCQERAVFEVTAKAGAMLTHAQKAFDPSVATPGNSSADLQRPYRKNAEVVPLRTVVYYIGEGSTPAAGNSLWRRASGASAGEELVEGIESMQFLYGERVGAAINYNLRADQVTNWNNVIAVRVALLVRSLSEYGPEKDSSTYQVLDVNVTAPSDRRMRQLFTTTATIRNQTL